MTPDALQEGPTWPTAVYFAASVLIVTAMIGISYLLGQRHKGRVTDEPYESGMRAIGAATLRINVKYYLVAMFFVIFDVEAVFVFAWAVSLRELGWQGYIEIVIFIGVLLAALVYLWRLGALDWGMRRYRDARQS